jgi:hypothetical protein
MPVLLPVADAADSFHLMILDNNWFAVNLIGLLSTLMITLGLPGFYLARHEGLNKLAFTGLLVAGTGLILFTCIQYYETFLWPAAAINNPGLVSVEGLLVSGDVRIVSGLVFSGILLGSGYVLFGISALRTGSYPKIPVWLLIIGAPVFGNGIVFPVRTIGLLIFCAGTIILSLKTIKTIP